MIMHPVNLGAGVPGGEGMGGAPGITATDDRRFPPPRAIEELDPGFVVKDSTGWKTGSLQGAWR
jgi:hypothetical protein